MKPTFTDKLLRLLLRWVARKMEARGQELRRRSIERAMKQRWV